jgi:kinesin family member 11
MATLDDFVTKARAQNSLHHEARLQALGALTGNVRQAYSSIQGEISTMRDRVDEFQGDIRRYTCELSSAVQPFAGDVCEPLAELRKSLQETPLYDYTPTGTTPPRSTYAYPTILPRTASHSSIIGKLRQVKMPNISPEKPASLQRSPSKTRVYNDTKDEVGSLLPSVTSCTSSNTGLREIDANVVAKQLSCNTEFSSSIGAKLSPEKDIAVHLENDDSAPPPTKRRRSNSTSIENRLPQKATRRLAGLADGRENVLIASGRRLRNRPSSG